MPQPAHLWTNEFAFVTDHACGCTLVGRAMRRGNWFYLRPDAEERLARTLQTQLGDAGVVHGATFSVDPNQWHLTLDIEDTLNPLYPVSLINLVTETLEVMGLTRRAETVTTPMTVGRYLLTFTYRLEA